MELDSQLHITEEMTLRQAVSVASEELGRNLDLAATAARDAELLLLHTLGISRSTIYAYPGRLLNAREQAAFARAVNRRMTLEPVQYITGGQEFFGLELEVAPGVLIPRPETELLVEAVLDQLPHDQPVHLLDVGTGSGAIAIALATRLPRATVTAVDVSPAALQIARRNVERYQMEDRVRLMRSDLMTALVGSERHFDAVVSNPPYVALPDRPTLHPQVRDYEPAQALFAGEDGLQVYRRLIPAAREMLTPRGLLAMEIGSGQRVALAELLHAWLGVRFVDDLQQIARVVLAWRP